MRILKFGGKSLDSFQKVQKICKFIKKIYKNDKKLIIIVSAMGNTTNNLCELASKFGYNNSQKRELASLLSTGEIQSATLFCMSLSKIGVPCKSLTGANIELLTFGDYLNSRIAYINKSKLEEILETNTVAVVCGFQGVNNFGETTTLGRGGSDTTAVGIASIMGCSAEIYSDFDGIFSGDPRISKFKKLKQVNYETMLSLSRAGAKVLDSVAIEIAKNKGVKIISKSSIFPEKSGSEICEVENDIISVSTISGLSKISVIFSNPLRMKKIASEILKIVEGLKFHNLKISDNEISFLIETQKMHETLLKIANALDMKKKQDWYLAFLNACITNAPNCSSDWNCSGCGVKGWNY